MDVCLLKCSFCIIYFFLSHCGKCQPFKRVECVGHREVAEISERQKCGEFFLLSDSSVVIYEGKPIIYTALSGRLIFFPDLPVGK